MLLELAGCTVDLARRTATRPGGATVSLTTREAELLAYLVARPGQLVSRQSLLVDVWGFAATADSRAPDAAIKRLRAKLERDPSQPEHLLTVHGEGYRFEPLTHRPAAAPVAASRGVLRFVGTTVDLDRMRVQRGGEDVALTSTEADLLAYLAPRGLVERDVLLREVWGHGSRSRAIDGALSRLRAKLGEGVLVGVRGQGYRLVGLIPPEEGDPDFVGRSATLHEVRAALERGARLVTLLGPGGIGKTELARRVAPEAPWVDLVDALDEPSLLAATCEALGVPAEGGRERVVERLARALAEHPRVVLDNCEGVRGPLRALLPEVLGAQTAIVATSRQRLALDEEHPIAVDRLAPPEAARLYLRRADQACAGRAPAFDPAAVAELVEALDGIPLAIELAAARAPVLPPRALLARLDLDVLRRPGGRHETMRAAIQGSWDLLPPDDQRALAVLSHLPGGFTAALAEELLDLPEPLERIQALRDASLIRPAADARLHLFVPVREFASEQPLPAEVLRHALAAMAELGEPARIAFIGTRAHRETARALLDEASNLAACVPLAIRHAPELAPPLALAAAQRPLLQGPSDLGVRLLEQALPFATSATRPSLLLALGRLHRTLVHEELAREAIDAALDEAPVGDPVRVHARLFSAVLYADVLDHEAAGPEYALGADEALAADWPEMAAFLKSRAAYYLRGDRDEAIRMGQRAIEGAEASGDDRLLGLAALWVGKMAWYESRWSVSLRHLRQALRAQEALGQDDQRASTYSTLCQVRLECGDHDGLEEELAEMQRLWRRLGDVDMEGLAHGIEGMYQLLVGQLGPAADAFDRARTVLGARQCLPRWWTALAEARLWLRAGDLRSAEHAVDDALEGFQGQTLALHRARALQVLARIHLARGDLDGATRLAAECRATAEASTDPAAHVEQWTLDGLVAAAAGDEDRARDHLEAARTAARSSGMDRPRTLVAAQLSALEAALDRRR